MAKDPVCLKFRFSGVCTHFRNGIVPGVPHRVVLPDATKVTFGALQIIPTAGANPTNRAFYYTAPHFPQFDLAGHKSDGEHNLNDCLNIQNVLANGGDVITPIRLQVLNAIDTEICGDLTGVHSLRKFLPDYAPASDVMLNGRAMCYLDFFGGTLSVDEIEGKYGFIAHGVISLKTDGPPKLMITPMIPAAPPVTDSSADAAPAPLSILTFPEGYESFTMEIKNLEFPPEDDSSFDHGAYDYLLHYETAQGGRPRVLADWPPGLDEGQILESAGPIDVGKSLEKIASVWCGKTQGGGESPSARLELVGLRSITPACADSQYP